MLHNWHDSKDNPEGIYLSYHELKELASIKGLSESKIEKIIQVAKTMKSTGVFCTGREMLHLRQVILWISSKV